MFVEPPRLLVVMPSVGALLSLEVLDAVALLSFYLSDGLNDGKRRLDLIPELPSLSYAYDSVLSS